MTFENLTALKKQISSSDFNKARYIFEENNRVKASVDALQKQDIETFGNLLFESHKGMKELYEITCEELDFLVNEAQKSIDVVGARMMGGGFGGCTINIIKKNKSQIFFNKLSQKYYEKFGISCTSIPIIISDGARIIKSETN